jgi:hypothetical protein
VKYAIKSVLFKQALPSVGGSGWMSHIKQGGVDTAEYDTAERLLTLISKDLKRRIPVEMIAEMVFGPTLANAATKS